MNLIVRNVEYSFADAPAFVIYETKLINEMYGIDTDLAPRFVQYQANLLATKWGTVTSPTA